MSGWLATAAMSILREACRFIWLHCCMSDSRAVKADQTRLELVRNHYTRRTLGIS